MAYLMVCSMIKISSAKTKDIKKKYIQGIRSLIKQIHVLEKPRNKKEKTEARNKVVALFDNFFNSKRNKKERCRILTNKRQMKKNDKLR